MIKSTWMITVVIGLFLLAACTQQPDKNQQTSDKRKPREPVKTENEDIQATASSELSHSNDPGRYEAGNLTDGDLSTAWVEGADKLGTGEYVDFSFPAATRVEGLVIFPGYQKSAATFSENAVPSSIAVEIDGNSKGTYHLRYRWEYMDMPGHGSFRHDGEPVNKKPRVIIFEHPVKAQKVRLVIKQGFEGSKFRDLYISEVEWLIEGQPARFVSGSARQALLDIRDHAYDSLQLAAGAELKDLSVAQHSITLGENRDPWVYNRHEPGYEFEKNEGVKKKIQRTRPSQKDVFNRYFRYTRPGLINKPVIYIHEGEEELILGSRSYQSEGVSEWVDCYPILVFDHSKLIRAWEIADLDGVPAPDQGYIPPLEDVY